MEKGGQMEFLVQTAQDNIDFDVVHFLLALSCNHSILCLMSVCCQSDVVSMMPVLCCLSEVSSMMPI